VTRRWVCDMGMKFSVTVACTVRYYTVSSSVIDSSIVLSSLVRLDGWMNGRMLISNGEYVHVSLASDGTVPALLFSSTVPYLILDSVHFFTSPA
jgi:hypothetical protein